MDCRDTSGGAVRILVVDDEERLAETLRRGLTAEGFVVVVVHEGFEGLELAASGEFDVIVLDIMLPGKHGYQIVRELREREVWTPVLMLSAKDGEYDLADAFDLGADDYLTKPFSFVVLLARLRGLLRRGAAPRPAVLAVGDLTLDPAAHRVQRGEQPIVLTPREFGVLEFMMRNSGRAVTKDEILRALNEAHIPCAPVKTAREVAYDPHLEARGFWVDVDHPRRGKTRVPISAIRLHTGGKSEITRPAPTLGQHTAAVLAELLGVAADELSRLRSAGVTVPVTEMKKA